MRQNKILCKIANWINPVGFLWEIWIITQIVYMILAVI